MVVAILFSLILALLPLLPRRKYSFARLTLPLLFNSIESILGENNRKGSFNSYAVGNFSYGETGCLPRSLSLDHISTETLDTFLTTFNDLIVNSDIVASLEFRETLSGLVN